MTDYYLKFDAEEQATEMLQDKHFAAIDMIGLIYQGTGQMIESEDGVFEETAPVAGWHVNIRDDASLPSELEPYQIFPITPTRGWF